MADLYVIKKEGKGVSKIVTTTESYLHAMREISAALSRWLSSFCPKDQEWLS